MANNRFKGKARAIERLGRIPAAVKADVKTQLGVQAEKLAQNIRRNVPVDEGDLRDSVQVRDSSVPERIRYTITEGEGQDYAAKALAIEFGREGDNPFPAQPHFYPTYRAYKRKIQNALAAAARKAARKLWGTP